MDDDILKMVLEAELAAAQPKKKDTQSGAKPSTQSKGKKSKSLKGTPQSETQPAMTIGSTNTKPKSSTNVGQTVKPEGVGIEHEDLLQEVMHVEKVTAEISETDSHGSEGAIFRQQIEDFRSQIESLKETIKQQKSLLNQKEHDIQVLTEQQSVLSDECAELRKRKSKDRSLHKAFQTRGLSGEAEISAAIQALGNGHKVSEILPAIAVIDAPKINRILDEHIQLVSSNLPTEFKLGVAQVQVSDDRCELVGQLDLAQCQRRFIDGLTVNGFREVLILGAPIRMLAPLRALAEHHQVSFSFGPAVHRLTHESLDQLVSDNAVVLVWNPEDKEFEPSILPKPPQVYSKAPNLAGFLLECGDILLQDEESDEGSES